jgi:ABC-type polysaccharide/polyol phosphate transport system ATPase subunit
MHTIAGEGMSFASDVASILYDLSIVVEVGECSGILGRNGSGRSTPPKITHIAIKPQRRRFSSHGRTFARWDNTKEVPCKPVKL